MTSRADEIQKLIADIDSLLINGGKRLPKLLSGNAPEARELLERVRNFLVKLKETGDSKENFVQPIAQKPASSLLAKFAEQYNNQSSLEQVPIGQAESHLLSSQLKSELTTLIQPLQAEVTALLQERSTLMQEIRHLEQKRLQNYSLSQQLANQEQIIGEFLQVLMSRLVPTVTPHIKENVIPEPYAVSTSHHGNSEFNLSTNLPLLESATHLEQLNQFAKDLDQRLLSLDRTVNVVFEALQRNINTYHESLSQALARMHSTGLQGEQVMVSFLNNLTLHLQQQSNNVTTASVGLEKETSDRRSLFPTLENTATVETTKPVITTETANPSLELSQPEVEFAPIVNSSADVADHDIDAMLLDITSDLSQSADIPTDALELEGFENWDNLVESSDLSLDLATPIIDSAAITLPITFSLFSDSSPTDEVDQLYASLFDIVPLSQPSVETTTDIAPEIETSAVESENILDTLPAPSVDEVEVSLDSIFSESDADLWESNQNQTPSTPPDAPQFPDLSSDFQHELFFEEEPESPSITPNDAAAIIESLVVQPSSADTITTLSELFTDESTEQLWTGLPPSEIGLTPDAPSAEVISQTKEPENLSEISDTYIAASPQENLLAPEVMQSTILPEISLNEQQLQQLNQDLANFDELFNYQSPNAYSFEDSPQPQNTVEHTTNVAFALPTAPISSPQTEADLDFSPANEKKKEATDGSSAENPIETPIDVHDSVWYLGIDLGTTGISAALLNLSQSVVYPIYWSAENLPGATCFPHSFRLPAEVYLPNVSVPQSDEATQQQKSSQYSAQLKPYLQVAVPYKTELQRWEPVIQFNEFSAGPLIWVVRSLSKLLLTLKSDRHSTTQGLVATAVGIEQPTFHSIMSKIAGVICTCPATWSEQYRFNVREALLTSKIIQHPQQVHFLEEAIASLISLCDQSRGKIMQVSDRDGLHPLNSSESLFGNTLVINIGATATEMALVDIPENLLQLKHQDFMLHSFAYASKGLEYDIICQLLIPPKYRQLRPENHGNSQDNTGSTWHWQPTFAEVNQMQWQSLGLDKLDLPRAGEPDIGTRIRLQQRLESSLLGQAVLEAALAIKLILQHQETFTLKLADQQWTLQKRDLENQVFVPFVRRLNRELNKLLVARGIPTEAINQAILTGGVASLGVVHNWLKQKLPNAKMIQDAYLGENGAPNCSRVALGLAMLPLHPQILEEPRQQYTDYFLFTELLRLLPERSLSFNEVLQLFETQGINTSICQQRLLAFLEGELPPGLIPSPPESAWLTQNSSQNLDYQAIASAPLFEKQGNLSYRPNSQQLLVLRRHLQAVKASTQQSLEEPYIVNPVLSL